MQEILCSSPDVIRIGVPASIQALSSVKWIAAHPLCRHPLQVAQRIRSIMRFLQQRDPLHGQPLLRAKLLLPIGLWEAAAAAVVRLTNEEAVVEAEVLL